MKNTKGIIDVEKIKDYEIATSLKTMTTTLFKVARATLVIYFMAVMIGIVCLFFQSNGEGLFGCLVLSIVAICSTYLIYMMLYTKYVRDLAYVKIIKDLDLINQKTHIHETFKCQNCGNVVYEGTTECPNCGLTFEQE